MRISDTSELKDFKDKFNVLGYGGEYGLEQLISAASVAGPELASFMGIPRAQLSTLINAAAANAMSIPASASSVISQAVYALGCNIDQVFPANTAPEIPSVLAPSLPQVNLVPQMPPIRSQGGRGTCVAHAALAAYEHYLITQGAGQDLSEQFLYWNCKKNDDHPTIEGTWLAIAVPLLERDGVCLETTWGYNPGIINGNEGQNPPPAGSQLEALNFRAAGFKQLSPTFVDDLKAELASNRCVAFSIPVFNSWYRSQWVAYSGDITMPIPNEIRVGGHAMCLVGYIDMPNNPELGFGRFILRNSWGSAWGINSNIAQGYGTIPYAYLAKMGVEAYSLP